MGGYRETLEATSCAIFGDTVVTQWVVELFRPL
jgi:hypothetical protein